MADYKVESITEARIADAPSDEPSSVYVVFAAGPEQVALTIDWRLASELIDRLAIVNNRIKHALSAPDWRAERIRTGCHRTGIALAILLVLPALWGLWVWVRGQLDPEAWTLIGAFLLAAPLTYGALWLIGWVVAGFVGKRERPTPEPQSTGRGDVRPQAAPAAEAP
jgi:hypothetical protein